MKTTVSTDSRKIDGRAGSRNSSRNGMFNSACLEYLDSPGTTNVCNYKLMFTSQDSGNYLRLNYGNLGSGGDNYSDHTPRSTLTVQEIAV